MQFYILPHCCIARNYKVASLSIAKAVVETYYPHLIESVNTALPSWQDDMIWQSLAPQTETPLAPVLLLMRDPVERFLSACAMLGLSVDEGLESDDIHFSPQYTDCVTDIYRFPDGIHSFCRHAVLPDLPVINRGNIKPPLTQREKIESRYADDMKVYSQTRESLYPC